MKAITLTAPYGTLIALAGRYPESGKHIETRGWSTPYRGELLIHQAKGLGPVGGRSGLYDLAFSDPDGYFYQALKAADVFCIDDLPRGAIVATCELIDCRPTNEIHDHFVAWNKGRQYWDLTDQERAFGDYSPNRFAWLLSNIRALETPIPCKGALSLWNYEGVL